MGKKTGYAAVGIGSLSSVLYLIAFILPLHSVGFYTLHKQVMRLQIHAAWAVQAAYGNEFCSGLPDADRRPPGSRRGAPDEYNRERWSLCRHNDRARTMSLLSMAHRWCSVTLEALWPSFCMGLSHAHLVGIVTLILVSSNAVIIQGTVCYLVYDYSVRKPARRTRLLAQKLTAIGCIVTLLALVCYALLVTLELDSMGHRLKILAPLFDKSRATGYGYGSFMLWTGLLAQVVQLIVLQYIKGHGEEALLEAKEQAAFEHDYGAVMNQQQKLGWGMPATMTPVAVIAAPPQQPPHWAGGGFGGGAAAAPSGDGDWGLPPPSMGLAGGGGGWG